MDPTARGQVLADYRQLRRTGAAPFAVMDAIRNDRANKVALYVSGDHTPPAWLMAEWRAATDYLNSMTKRTAWWWTPTTTPRPPRQRQARRRRTKITEQTGSTIPT